MWKDCIFRLETSISVLSKIAGIKNWSASKREAEMISKELQSLFSKLQENAVDSTIIIVDLKSFFLKLVMLFVDLPVVKIVFLCSPIFNLFSLALLALDHGIVTESRTDIMGFWFVFFWDFLMSTVVADESLPFFPF